MLSQSVTGMLGLALWFFVCLYGLAAELPGAGVLSRPFVYVLMPVQGAGVDWTPPRRGPVPGLPARSA